MRTTARVIFREILVSSSPSSQRFRTFCDWLGIDSWSFLGNRVSPKDELVLEILKRYLRAHSPKVASITLHVACMLVENLTREEQDLLLLELRKLNEEETAVQSA